MNIVTEHSNKKCRHLTFTGNSASKNQHALQKEFHKEEGPFVKALDNVLASFHVQRLAYYSGSFVGNHVHRALKAGCKLLAICHGAFLSTRSTTLQHSAIALLM